MQFWLIMLVLFTTVALGAFVSPLAMPVPLLSWLIFQVVLSHARQEEHEE